MLIGLYIQAVRSYWVLIGLYVIYSGCQELLGAGDVSHSGVLKKQLTYRKNRMSIIGTLVRKLPCQ